MQRMFQIRLFDCRGHRKAKTQSEKIRLVLGRSGFVSVMFGEAFLHSALPTPNPLFHVSFVMQGSHAGCSGTRNKMKGLLPLFCVTLD